jgi:hypothetical protein
MEAASTALTGSNSAGMSEVSLAPGTIWNEHRDEDLAVAAVSDDDGPIAGCTLLTR